MFPFIFNTQNPCVSIVWSSARPVLFKNTINNKYLVVLLVKVASTAYMHYTYLCIVGKGKLHHHLRLKLTLSLLVKNVLHYMQMDVHIQVMLFIVIFANYKSSFQSHCFNLFCLK